MCEQKKYDKEFWKNVAVDPKYNWLVDEIKKIYEESTENPLPMLTYSFRMTYYKHGDRSMFANPFFKRRKAMHSSAILSLIYPENEEYFTNLQDCIWAICDEFCWATPPHVKNTLEDRDTIIDLSTATTAYALSEIYLLFADKLDDIVAKRIKREIKHRIIDVFLNYTQHWEKAENNWLTVTSCGVGASFIRLFPELFDKAKDRLYNTMNRYMEFLPDDGACLEGGGYWNFGFGHYIWLAELIYDFTGGKVDFMSYEKVKRTAAFGQKLFLKGNSTISFADSSRSIKPNISTAYYLARRFPDTNKVVANKNGLVFGEHWAFMINAFVYYDPDIPVHDVVYGTHYFADAGWYITTKESYSFAVKAGNNDEPHNHNDVGAFIIATDNGQEICDVGHGKYVKSYFGDERYSIFCNSSRSHSVPIINGVYQKDGKEYCGKMTVDDDVVVIDMKNAYSVPGLNKLERTFKVENDGVIMRDVWIFAMKPLQSGLFRQLCRQSATVLLRLVTSECIMTSKRRLLKSRRRSTAVISVKLTRQYTVLILK